MVKRLLSFQPLKPLGFRLLDTTPTTHSLTHATCPPPSFPSLSSPQSKRGDQPSTSKRPPPAPAQPVRFASNDGDDLMGGVPRCVVLIGLSGGPERAAVSFGLDASVHHTNRVLLVEDKGGEEEGAEREAGRALRAEHAAGEQVYEGGWRR